MERAVGAINGYCVAGAPEHECLSSVEQRFLCAVFRIPCAYTSSPWFNMVHYDIKSMQTLRDVWLILLTIVPMVYMFAAARFICQLVLPQPAHAVSLLRFALEFVIILVPMVVSVNVANFAVGYFVAVASLCVLVLMWWTQCWQKAKKRNFDEGLRRPFVVTLDRAAISLMTVLCILAVDFDSFADYAHKTRRFGTGLMDTGIGLFVFSMGTVSRPARKFSDLVHMLRIVVPLLILGISRTVVINLTNYHQDEHEYGKHLNAFFTLGLTKLFGVLVSLVSRKNGMLVAMGWAVLVLHEFTLQLAISDFVMTDGLKRTTFLVANREGICSLPGFVAIYIISMHFGQLQKSKKSLSFEEFKHKLIRKIALTVFYWLLVVVSIFTVGIARVTCNFGYVIWIVAIAFLMTTLFTIVFHLFLDTSWPVDVSTGPGIIGGGDSELLLKGTANDDSRQTSVPILVEAVNFNGLIFFLVGNVLTGGVNIFLEPRERSDFDSVVILTLYMLTALGFVYILFRCKIRIG